MLANKQFVENRVWEDDETEPKKAEADATAELPDTGNTEKTIEKFTEAVTIGIAAMKGSPFWASMEADPSVEVEESTVNPYMTRPLPFIVGTAEYHDDDRCGLEEFDEQPEMDDNESDSDLSSDFSETSEEEESTNFDSDDYSDTESTFSESTIYGYRFRTFCI